VQPAPPVEQAYQGVGVVELGVDEVGRAFGVTNKVHL